MDDARIINCGGIYVHLNRDEQPIVIHNDFISVVDKEWGITDEDSDIGPIWIVTQPFSVKTNATGDFSVEIQFMYEGVKRRMIYKGDVDSIDIREV